MRRRRVFGNLVCLLLAASALVAGEFWKERAYTKWTEAEVRTIITGSPWVQAVQVGGPPAGYDWGGGSRPEGGAMKPTQGPTAATATGELPRVGGRGEDVLAGSSSAQPGARTYYVIWSSAKTVRRALARNRVLLGMATPEQADLALQQPATSYTITIIGLDLAAFGQVGQDEVKARSYLRVGSRKEKVAPLEVQIFRHPTRGTVDSVTFSFERTLASGEPLIQPTEKKVEFGCELKKLKIKTRFEMKRMKLGNEFDL